MNPLISIIIPVYNGKNFLQNCFQTLENQTIGMNQLECIFVNDASDDCGASWEMLRKFENKYPDNVLIIDSKLNHRVGGSRNIALGYAKGTYIAFMDQDDTLHPTMLENMTLFLEKYQCDVVMCRFWKVPDTTIREPKRMGQDYILDINNDKEREKLLVANQLGYVVWDKLYRRELIFENDIRFPDGKFFEDTFFGGLIAGYLKRLGVINKTLYFYRQYATSTNESMTLKQRHDLLEVNNLKWNEFAKRGIYARCKEAIEYDYIQNYFFGGIKNFSHSYKKIPYRLFTEMSSDIRKRISFTDYQENEYLQKGLSDWEKCLLELTWCDINEADWETITLI